MEHFNEKELRLLYRLIEDKTKEFPVDSPEFRVLIREMTNIREQM
jgi:hypothetical protein